MARLIKNGMKYTMLTEQHRMVEDIALLCNTLTYKGKLTNAPGTALNQRLNASRFPEWAQSFDKSTLTPSNRIMLDITQGGPQYHETQEGLEIQRLFRLSGFQTSAFAPEKMQGRDCRNPNRIPRAGRQLSPDARQYEEGEVGACRQAQR